MILSAARWLLASCFAAVAVWPTNLLASPIAVWEDLGVESGSKAYYLAPRQKLLDAVFRDGGVLDASAIRIPLSGDILLVSAFDYGPVYISSPAVWPANSYLEASQSASAPSYGERNTASDIGARSNYTDSPTNGSGSNPLNSAANGVRGSSALNNGAFNNGGAGTGSMGSGLSSSPSSGQSSGRAPSNSEPTSTNPAANTPVTPSVESTPSPSQSTAADHAWTTLTISTSTYTPTFPASTSFEDDFFAGSLRSKAIFSSPEREPEELVTPLSSPLLPSPTPTPEPGTLAVTLICLAVMAIYVRGRFGRAGAQKL